MIATPKKAVPNQEAEKIPSAHQDRLAGDVLVFKNCYAEGSLQLRCPTSAAVTDRGPVVVYRGRQEASGTRPSAVDPSRPTVRDIYITRLERDHWTKPHAVYPDNWVINACPDNGPSVDADENSVVVSWWTHSGDRPKVQVAFSNDAGDTFRQTDFHEVSRAEGPKGQVRRLRPSIWALRQGIPAFRVGLRTATVV
jgi:hypothetical protein